MTGSELRRIRNSLDLSRVEFGRALGYRGENVSRMVRRLEYPQDGECDTHVGESTGFPE